MKTLILIFICIAFCKCTRPLINSSVHPADYKRPPDVTKEILDSIHCCKDSIFIEIRLSSSNSKNISVYRIRKVNDNYLFTYTSFDIKDYKKSIGNLDNFNWLDLKIDEQIKFKKVDSLIFFVERYKGPEFVRIEHEGHGWIIKQENYMNLIKKRIQLINPRRDEDLKIESLITQIFKNTEDFPLPSARPWAPGNKGAKSND